MVAWKPAEPVHVGCPGGQCVRCIANRMSRVMKPSSRVCNTRGCTRRTSRIGVSICERCYAGNVRVLGGKLRRNATPVEDVAVVRALVREGMSRSEVARVMKMGSTTIRRIVDRVGRYARLDPDLPRLRAGGGQEQRERNYGILTRKPYRISAARSVATRLMEIGRDRGSGEEEAA